MEILLEKLPEALDDRSAVQVPRRSEILRRAAEY
jgi:hypothetical protein